MSEKLPRFVELVRVSTAEQAERDTPQAQKLALDKLRQARPGTLVRRIEVPEGVSGAKDFDQRPDLQELASLAAAKAFDELRVFDVSRISRHPDLRQRALVFGLLADAGATVIDVKGQRIDPRDEVGELHWGMLGWMASQERKRIALRMRSGMERKVQEGKLAAGRPPTARLYDKHTGRWSVDEEGAAVVRRIFSRCLEGWSLSKQANDLNAKGILTFGGNTWTAAHVSRILHDRAATGTYTWSGYSIRVPALVSEEVFAAAAERLKTNNSNQGGRPAKIPALLRKLIACGECEHAVYVDKAGRRNDRHYYYVCPSCRTYHRTDKVDAAIKERVLAWLKRPDLLKAGAERTPSKDDPAADVKAAQRELHALDVRQEKLARLVTRGLLEDHVADKLLAEIQKSRAATQQELLAAQARVDAAAERERVSLGLEAKLEELRKGLRKKTTAEWRTLLEVLFRRTASTGVRLFSDGAIELLGSVVPLNDEGAAALAKSARKPCTSRRSG